MRLVIRLGCVFLLLCATLQAQVPDSQVPEAQVPELDPAAVPGALGETAYQLGAGDRIGISVFNQPDLSGEYALDGKGRFSMPLIGTVEAGGMTSAELETLLIDRLKPDYLVNPRVYVQVKNYRPYYLMGEVNSTGAFPYVAGISYLKAIAIAGGFTYRARQGHVYVIRANDPEQNEIRISIDEKVQPGDIIRVDERMF